ncbi:MAG: hypothetical protein AAGE94_13270 [Acidobacteriota bacterium]
MRRLTVLLAVLFACVAWPAVAEDIETSPTDSTPAVIELAEVDAADVIVEANADAEPAAELFTTFDQTLKRLATTAGEGPCFGWGITPGCSTKRDCYQPGKCGSTGGTCQDNCCYCY